jgi:hypothetical protein
LHFAFMISSFSSFLIRRHDTYESNPE